MDAHMTGKGCRAAGTGTGEAARRFLAWLAADANPALTGIIQAWLWQPCSGGPGVLPASAWDVALLRAEILATWPGLARTRKAGRSVRPPAAEPASAWGLAIAVPSAQEGSAHPAVVPPMSIVKECQ